MFYRETGRGPGAKELPELSRTDGTDKDFQRLFYNKFEIFIHSNISINSTDIPYCLMLNYQPRPQK